MPQEWMNPGYHYNGQATLQSLLSVFMKANRNPRIEDVAKAMEVKPGTLRKWLTKGLDNTLTTSRMAQFISVTGIEVDRLMVIETKREILADLDHVDDIRADNPSLAWMLTRNPDLRNKINFEELATRGEILSELQKIIAEIDGGLVGLQLGESHSTINSWGKIQSSSRKEATVRMPAGEALKRCIIMLTIGFIRAEDQKHPCRDSVRFRILGERLLGASIQDVLGVETFSQALKEVFRGLEGRTTSVIKHKTDLSESVITRLVDWSYPSNGRTSTDVMIQIIKILIERRCPDILNRYKLAVASLKESGIKPRVTAPVYWHRVDDQQEQAARSQDPTPSKPAPKIKHVTEAPGQAIRSIEPVEVLPTSSEPRSIPESTLITLMSNIAGIREILSLHPELAQRLPDEWKGGGTNEDLCQVCPLEATLLLGQTEHSKHLESAAIRRVRELEVIVRTICSWPPDVRERVLRDMDNPLVTLYDLFYALELEEPQRFLEQQGLQLQAVGLVGDQGKKQS